MVIEFGSKLLICTVLITAQIVHGIACALQVTKEMSHLLEKVDGQLQEVAKIRGRAITRTLDNIMFGMVVKVYC